MNVIQIQKACIESGRMLFRLILEENKLEDEKK